MTDRRGTGRLVSAIAFVAAAAASVYGLGRPQAPDAFELGARLVARALQPGEVVRLDVTCVCPGATPRARVFDAEVDLFPAGGTRWQGLFGIDLDVEPGPYTVALSAQLPDGRRREQTIALTVAEKAFPTRTLRVAPSYVDPPAAEVERILREAKTLQTLFETVTPRRFWEGAFERSLAGRTSGNFGARSVFNGQPRSPHGGVDFAGATGTPIAAPAAGRVVLAEDLYFTGNTIVLDHGLGLYSLFAHLSTMDVAVGAMVEHGAVVGNVGATGRVTGPHLHWSVRLYGARVDPLSLLAATAPDTPALAQRSAPVFLTSVS